MSNHQHMNSHDGVTPPNPIRGAGKHAAPSHMAPRASAPSTRPTSESKKGETPSHKPGRARKRAAIAAGIIVGILVVAYAAGVAAFSNFYYPGTTIAGVDVSLKSAQAAADELDAQTASYNLTVEGDGFSWQFTPSADAPVFDSQEVADRVLASNDAMLWPARLVSSLTSPQQTASQSDETDLSAEVDRSLFSTAFDEQAFLDQVGTAVDAFNEGRSGTFDAAGAYDTESGTFSAERARENEKLNRDNVSKFALIALSRLDETANLEEIGNDAFEPLSGGITDDQLQAACDAANDLLGVNVTFKLGDSDAGTIDGSTVAQWIVFDENLTPTLDQNALTAWAQNLAQSFNTVGTERTYTRPDGKQITIGGGTFGWQVDTDAVVQAVQNAVQNRQTGDIEVPTSSQGDKYAGAGQPDWGAYVDVDISEQHARYYDANGNLVWETGVVTGKPDGENDTPTGVYKVNNKARNITLVSQNKDPKTGEPEYESPVDYWIAFKGSSWGFHDASWQPSWVYSDPTAYRSRGSHGCINTPYDKVAELYDLLQVGTCVIVHN
ncbi:L,D-transpeptidase family protein [Collinsella sp. An2]|uniref:L,D-transpeptidase family protein n=1 Tax=Collinsella sp. An2 TaxID=1965585 RepID=UPI000B36C62A|nr:L,D-transpeptidase family protein [Collinsella sp. An2]OUP10093.1 hypothetical protein B5F33_03305 [Collinsella sp. An2]